MADEPNDNEKKPTTMEDLATSLRSIARSLQRAYPTKGFQYKFATYEKDSEVETIVEKLGGQGWDFFYLNDSRKRITFRKPRK